MNNNKLITSALAGVLAVGLSSVSSSATAAKQEMEKCYGVVKAKMNDCGTSAHSCAGEAKTDGDKNEWVFLPAGTCSKLVGGSTEPGSSENTNDDNS